MHNTFFVVDLVSMRIFFSVFLGFIYTFCCVKCDLMPKNDHVLNITINVQWFAICRWGFFVKGKISRTIAD